MDWQNFVVVVMVAVSAAYVGRSAWRSLRGSSGCGGCGGCGSKTAGAVTFVPADSLKVRRRL